MHYGSQLMRPSHGPVSSSWPPAHPVAPSPNPLLPMLRSASTGLPWAAGIVLTTIALRTALLPVVFGSMRNNTIIMNLRPEMELHSARMRQCQANGDSVGAVPGGCGLRLIMK